MANEDARTSAPTVEDSKGGARREVYERPVLTHLGSVNRLTLAASTQIRNDMSLGQPKMSG